MIKETLKNASLRKSEYFKTPQDFFNLKKYYENQTSYLGDSSNENYLKQHRDELLDDLNFNLNTITPSKKLSNLIIPIIGHCNLNCKYCTSFSPLVRAEKARVSEIKKDLLRIRELDFIPREISFEGGEPLLHPEILGFIEDAREIFPSSVIVILTNGTLLKSFEESFFKKLASLNCEIIIDDYFENSDFSYFKKIVDRVNLSYEIHSCFSGRGYFFNLNLNPSTKNYSFEENFKNFISCEKANKCITLLNHKLYTCGSAAYIFRLNNYFNTTYPDRGINIYEYDGDKIAQFLARPCSLCGYCNFPEETNQNYKLSTREKEEWIKESDKQ
jgi:hypothetical protein